MQFLRGGWGQTTTVFDTKFLRTERIRIFVGLLVGTNKKGTLYEQRKMSPVFQRHVMTVLSYGTPHLHPLHQRWAYVLNRGSPLWPLVLSRGQLPKRIDVLRDDRSPNLEEYNTPNYTHEERRYLSTRHLPFTYLSVVGWQNLLFLICFESFSKKCCHLLFSLSRLSSRARKSISFLVRYKLNDGKTLQKRGFLLLGSIHRKWKHTEAYIL